jgi:hypothetical protein
MTAGVGATRDLVALVADKDMEQTVSGLLAREAAIGMRHIELVIYVHPSRDSGCRTGCHEFLRPFVNKFERAIVMFDREGSGGDPTPRRDLELRAEDMLSAAGWDSRCAAIVLDPELESWVWSDSPEVDRVVGWAGRQPPLREWLRRNGFECLANGKPERPKEALRSALRHVRKQPSSSLFRALARDVSVRRCVDPSFQKFVSTLQTWFPTEQGPTGGPSVTVSNE